MAIFSKIKSGFNKIIQNVKEGFASLGSQKANVSDAYTALQTNKNTVSPFDVISTQKDAVPFTQLMTRVPTTSGSTKTGSSSTPQPSQFMTVQGMPLNQQLPVTISAGRVSTSSSSSNPQQTAKTLSATTAIPTSISARTLGGTTSNGALESTSSPAAITLASAPSAYNPGQTDSTKLAGTLSSYYKRNPKTGAFEPVDTTEAQTGTGQSTQDIITRQKALADEILGQRQNVFDDIEVKQAKQRKERIQEALKSPVSELNAVIAKQNQDLIQLRQTGSQEGVTEAVYGGQQNAINYNAAIRALPLQASIATLQGDLKLAQDYLSELVTIKEQQIDRQYDYNKSLLSSISSAIDKKDARTYEEMKSRNDRIYQEQKDLGKFKLEVALKVAENVASTGGDPTRVLNNISEATSRENVLKFAGNYLAKPQVSGKYNSTQDKYIDQINTGVSNNFNYKAVNSAKGFADGVLVSLKQNTGLGDISAINQFQKVIDEGAVTREQDVKLVQSAQSLADTLKLKISKLQKGDQLSPKQRTDMENAVKALYEAKVRSLADDPYVKAQIIKAEQNGIGIEDTILGQLGTLTSSVTNTDVKVTPEVQALRTQYGY